MLTYVYKFVPEAKKWARFLPDGYSNRQEARLALVAAIGESVYDLTMSEYLFLEFRPGSAPDAVTFQ